MGFIYLGYGKSVHTDDLEDNQYYKYLKILKEEGQVKANRYIEREVSQNNKR